MNDDVRKYMNGITLFHMMDEIDLGDVILNDGPAAIQQLAVWLVQRFFWNHPSNKDGKLSKDVAMSILDQAKYLATTYFIKEWGGLGERATLFILSDAQSTGWHTSEYFNYENLEEMLLSILDDDENSIVEASNLSFIVKQLLPAASRYGIDPMLLWGMSGQAKKLRLLVPTARYVLNNKDFSEEEKEENLHFLVGRAADDKISSAEFKADTDQIRGKRNRANHALEGYEFILPNNETWIVIKCPSQADERSVEMMLGKKVELVTTDYMTVIDQLLKQTKFYKKLSKEAQAELVKAIEGRNNGRKPEGVTELAREVS